MTSCLPSRPNDPPVIIKFKISKKIVAFVYAANMCLLSPLYVIKNNSPIFNFLMLVSWTIIRNDGGYFFAISKQETIIQRVH